MCTDKIVLNVTVTATIKLGTKKTIEYPATRKRLGFPQIRLVPGKDEERAQSRYASAILIERNPPPGGVSYLLCSLIKNRV